MTVQEIGDEFTVLSHQGKAQADVMHVSGEVVKNITGIELIGDDIALIISEKIDPELKDKLLDLKANFDLAIEGRDIKIKELETENAELKEKLNFSTQYYQGEKAKDQLAKAKDLIEDMYDKIPASHSDYYKDVMERARQFIKEIEK